MDTHEIEIFELPIEQEHVGWHLKNLPFILSISCTKLFSERWLEPPVCFDGEITWVEEWKNGKKDESHHMYEGQGLVLECSEGARGSDADVLHRLKLKWKLKGITESRCEVWTVLLNYIMRYPDILMWPIGVKVKGVSYAHIALDFQYRIFWIVRFWAGFNRTGFVDSNYTTIQSISPLGNSSMRDYCIILKFIVIYEKKRNQSIWCVESSFVSVAHMIRNFNGFNFCYFNTWGRRTTT